MPTFASEGKVAEELCNALGLKHVRSLDIRLAVGEIGMAVVRYYLTEDDVTAMIPIMKKYELVEREG
jgi:hypothetical protein